MSLVRPYNELYINKMLINRSRDVMMIGTRVDEPQITIRIAIFRESSGHCFICYEQFEGAERVP